MQAVYRKPIVRVALVAATMSICALSACSSEPPWHLANITGHLPSLRFSGAAQDGTPIDARAVQGKVVLLYFGFTHCAEDCPIVMARLSEVLKHLGKAADQVRIVFISLDPAHDRPPVLGRYLAVFDGAHSIGVTASSDMTESLAKRYRVAFYPSSAAALDADLPHSAATYVFDRSGRARLLMTPGDSSSDVEQDLTRLVAENNGLSETP